MRHKCFSPTPSISNDTKDYRCVVELTTDDLVKAVCQYAASRDEFIPYGHGELKRRRSDGTYLLTIRFRACEL